jgi:photosystem II stability/assembly factor-like uncharacterized protein
MQPGAGEERLTFWGGLSDMRRSIWVLAAAGALLLAGCGGAGTPAGAATGTATPPPATASATATSTATSSTPPATASATTTATASAATSLFLASGPASGVVFADAQHGWALVDCGSTAAGKSPLPGDACRLLATSDGGSTWAPVAAGLPAGANLQFVDDRTGFASVQGGGCVQGTCPGAVLGTTDAGATWKPVYSGPLQLTSVDYSTPSTGWAIVAGKLQQSTDGGAAWTAVSTPTCQLRFVRFSSAQDGVAGGGGPSGPCTITTSDGGSSWQSTLTGTADPALKPALAAFSASFDPQLQRNWQGGAQCSVADARLLGSGSGWLYLNCDPFDPGALMVARTTDGGANWQFAWGIDACLMGCHSDGLGQEPLYFLDGSTAWRAAQSGEARTTDGGQTWASGGQLCQPGGGCPVSVAFVTATRGWAVTRDGLFASTDGGRTWTKQWPTT